RVKVTPNDGTVDGSTVTSASVTIVNSAPVVDSASIDQSSPKTNIGIAHICTPDTNYAHPPPFAYQWQKSTDGAATSSLLAGRTSSSPDLSTLSLHDALPILRVKVTPNDGTVDGSTVTSASVTIVNSAPVVDSASIDQSSPKT